MTSKSYPSGAKLTTNSAVAERLRLALSKKLVTRVGILGAKTNRLKQLKGESNAAYKKRSRKYIKDRIGDTENLSNADIGLIHEKGMVTKNIPRRSFLEVPLVQNVRKVANAGQIIKRDLEESVEKGGSPDEAWRLAHRHLGIIGEQIVQRAFEVHGPGWAPNSPVTIARKGSDSPLINTAQLRRGVMSDVVEKKQ